jgi:hypothetical protein
VISFMLSSLSSMTSAVFIDGHPLYSSYNLLSKIGLSRHAKGTG